MAATRASAVLLGALLVAGLFASAGQERLDSRAAAAQAEKPIQHEVSVTLKLIQVYVIDRKGNPVPDMTRDEFIVADNGERKALTEFERHSISGPAAAPRAEAAETATPVSGQSVSTPENPKLTRKFFLFFDFAFNNQRGTRKAVESAFKFLEKNVKPGDEVGLISYSLTRGLVIHEFLTTDHKKVREALTNISVKDVAGRASEIELEYWRQAAEGAAPPLGEAAPNEPSLDWRRQEAKGQAQNFILELTALAKALRYVPGQKHLIFFSTGIPSSMIYGNIVGTPTGSSGRADRARADYGDYILRGQNEEMMKELATSNCTFFAFDTREAAKVDSLFAMDERTFGTGYRDMFTTGGVSNTQNLIFKDENATGLYTLTKLSKDTGGQYYSNINIAQDNLDRVEVLTGTYYVLGYPIAASWDGRFHKISVETTRKGCDVRSQSGYFNPLPFKDLTPLEKQLQLTDLALSDNPVFQTPVPAALKAFPGPEDDRTVVLLMKLAPEAIDRFAEGKSEIVRFIFDAHGDLADLRRSEESLERFKNKSLFYSTRIALDPGEYKCRVVVRNMENGAAAVATATALVPALTARSRPVALLPPLLLSDDAAEAVYLEGRSKLAQTEILVSPERMSPYPFEFRNYAPLFGTIPRGHPATVALLPCVVTESVDLDAISLRAAVIDVSSGRAVNLKIEYLNRVPRADVVYYPIAIETANLEQGTYALHFFADEAGSGTASHASATFTIR
jgi:VWFA-related protein